MGFPPLDAPLWAGQSWCLRLWSSGMEEGTAGRVTLEPRLPPAGSIFPSLNLSSGWASLRGQCGAMGRQKVPLRLELLASQGDAHCSCESRRQKGGPWGRSLPVGVPWGEGRESPALEDEDSSS